MDGSDSSQSVELEFGVGIRGVGGNSGRGIGGNLTC